MKIKTHAEVEIPIVPNFLRMGNRTIPITAIEEKDLRKIGKLWTEELVKKSKTKFDLKAEQIAGCEK